MWKLNPCLFICVLKITFEINKSNERTKGKKMKTLIKNAIGLSCSVSSIYMGKAAGVQILLYMMRAMLLVQGMRFFQKVNIM